MFPISIGCMIRIKDKLTFSAQAIEDEIASTLMVRGIPVHYRPEGGFRFRFSIFRLLGWADFQGISSGTVRCIERPEDVVISCRLRFFHLVLFLSSLFLLFRWLDATYSPLHIPVKYYLVGWICLVSANMFFSLLEFRRFLRSCAAESSKRVFYWKKQNSAANGTNVNG